jgi:hypothetical protein
MRLNLSVVQLLAMVGSLASTTVLAQTYRIAYVTSNSGTTAERRTAELQTAVEQLWRVQGGSPASFAIDTSRFDLREKDEVSIPEAAAHNKAVIERVLKSNPHVIYAAGASAAKAFAGVTSTIPIVIGCKCNPGPTSRRWNLVMNVCSPEKNITGFTRYDLRVVAPTSHEKPCDSPIKNDVQVENLFPARLQALRDSREPSLQRIGLVMFDDYDETKWQYLPRARQMGVMPIVLRLLPEQINDLPKIYQDNRLDGALMFPGPTLDVATSALVRVTARIPVPTMFPWDEADSGAWMHFGTKVDLAEEAARYIVALLRGTPVSRLPISFPTEYELVVNHKLAKEHGWVFPRKFLLLPQREPRNN